jgi:tRNA(fMet)-specific endonuclease VapC
MAGLRYLLDTNVLSEPSRPRPDAGVQSRLRAHRNEVCAAAPILHEMQYGLARLPNGARKRRLTRYLDQVLRGPLQILPYDREAALWHAEERARLSLGGRTPPYVDGQIAAIAATNDVTLVTRNAGDFDDFTNLRVENWFA